MSRRIAAVVLILVLLAGLSFYSQGLVKRAFDACVNYRSPYLFAMPPGEATPGLSAQVVLIVVDGLRADTALMMRSVQTLREKGTSATLITGQPSLSVPGAANIESGTLQEIHGVTTNWYRGELKVDTIFAAAQRVGLTWFGADGDSYARFGQVKASPARGEWRSFTEMSPEEYDRAVFEAGLAAVKAGTNLVFMHFSATDEMAHAHGADSDQYRQAAATIDGYLGQIVDLTLARGGTVLITADHGHIATGGHGGGERAVTHVLLALAGAGVRPGQPGAPELIASQADLAPTVAALIGAPVPSSATGQILYQLLQEPAGGWSARAVREAERQTVFTDQYLVALKAKPLPPERRDELKRLEDGLQAGRDVFADAQRYTAALAAARAEARASALAATRVRRIPLTVLLALLPLVLFAPFWRTKLFGRAALCGLVYFAGYNFLYFVVHGYRWSFSAFNSEQLMGSFFNARMAEAAASALLAALALGLIARRLQRRGLALTWVDLAEGSAVTSLSVAYLLELQALAFYLVWDVRFPFYLPNLTAGFKFYMDMLQLVAVGLAALPALAVAVLAGQVRLSSGSGARA